jgi:hypothetical protein
MPPLSHLISAQNNSRKIKVNDFVHNSRFMHERRDGDPWRFTARLRPASIFMPAETRLPLGRLSLWFVIDGRASRQRQPRTPPVPAARIFI